MAQSAVFLSTCPAPFDLVLPSTLVGAETRSPRHPFLRDLRLAANAKTINLRHEGSLVCFPGSYGRAHQQLLGLGLPSFLKVLRGQFGPLQFSICDLISLDGIA